MQTPLRASLLAFCSLLVLALHGCGGAIGRSRSGLFYTARANAPEPIPATPDTNAANGTRTGQTGPAEDTIDSRAALNTATPGTSAVAQTSSSPLSFGSMIGISVPLYAPCEYTVRDRVVRLKHSTNPEDYILPGVFVLPSFSLIGTPGRSLALIVPFGINSQRDASIGIGLSYGFSVRSTAEVGVSLAMIWTQAPRLTEEQESSLRSGMPLPAAVSDTIESSLRPSIGLGIYIVPQL